MLIFLFLFQIAKQMRNYSYVIGDGSSKEVLVVDPCWDVDGIVAFLKKENLKCVGSVCTHYHWDHVGGHVPDSMLRGLGLPPQMIPLARVLPGIKELGDALGTNAHCYMHEREAEQIQSQTKIPASTCRLMKHDQIFEVGCMRIRCLHTPGHTPGSMCLVLEDFSPKRVLTGDTLFIGSFGRIDGQDCSASDLWDSINRVLGGLPDDTVVYPGMEKMIGFGWHARCHDNNSGEHFLRLVFFFVYDSVLADTFFTAQRTTIRSLKLRPLRGSARKIRPFVLAVIILSQ